MPYQPSADGIDGLAAIVRSAGEDVALARERVAGLAARLATARRATEDLVSERRHLMAQRLRLAGVPHDPLRSESLEIEGLPSQRLRIRRLSIGEPVRRPFSGSQGVVRSCAEAADVQALWDRLITFERACAGDVIEGGPVTVLDVPGARVSLGAGVLRVSLCPPAGGPTTAVPRFAFTVPARKRRNFGHWLLDCVPQVQALLAVDPSARLLVPAPVERFQHTTLALTGIAPEQIVEWDGAPLDCARLLVLQHDGRHGGGRPLSPLLALRARLGAGTTRGRRRIYVARRDARARRTWLTNEADVEELFRRRGFEIVVMTGCPLDEQIRIFRDAAIVAGVSGAGLADTLFAPASTHVIVLTTESLVRWYAEESGARSLWSSGDRAPDGQLAALGDSPRFYAHLAAAFGQVCHSFLSSDTVPLDVLSGFLDEALARAEAA